MRPPRGVPGLTLQREVHDAGVQGVDLGAQVGRHAEQVGGAAHGVLREGALVEAAQAVEGRGLRRGRGVGGHARLRLH